jgi:hypothetical protein
MLVRLNVARVRLFPVTQWREAGKHEVLGTLLVNISPLFLSSLTTYLVLRSETFHSSCSSV